MTDDPETALRLEQLHQAFRPAGPVDQERLFTGREHQRMQISEVASSPGNHAVVYGERGVGKTSLAATSVTIARNLGMMALRVNCAADNDFQLIWDAVVDQIAEQHYLPDHSDAWDPHIAGFLDIIGNESSALAEPDRVRLALQRLAGGGRVIVFFDEYDQVQDEDIDRQMANTIKSLSDHLVDATIVIVGVASDVDELIEGHQSIQRCLQQIHMPRMDTREISDILERGFTELNLSTDPSVDYFVQKTALGFPEYAHRLGRAFAKCAIQNVRRGVTTDDLQCAIDDAVSGVEKSMKSLFNEATHSRHPKAIHKEVIMACALADTDNEGYFAPKALAEPLSVLLGRKVRSDTYNDHLVDFTEERGPLLERRGEPKRWRYRFHDPAMAPYVVLYGAAEGRIVFSPPTNLGGSNEPELPFEQ